MRLLTYLHLILKNFCCIKTSSIMMCCVTYKSRRLFFHSSELCTLSNRVCNQKQLIAFIYRIEVIHTGNSLTLSMSILYSFARFKTPAGMQYGTIVSGCLFKYLILPITSITSCFGIFISTHNGGVVVASSKVQPRRILFLTVSSLISSSSISF